MDIRSSIAAQSYATARPATAPKAGLPGATPEGGEGGAFGAIKRAVSSFTETLQRSDDTARAAMIGGADPHALVQALAETQLAVEAVVTVRDRVVEAYQEILRMPV